MERVCLLVEFHSVAAQFGNVFHDFLAPAIFHLEKPLTLFDTLSICVNIPPDFEKWKATATHLFCGINRFVGFFFFL